MKSNKILFLLGTLALLTACSIGDEDSLLVSNAEIRGVIATIDEEEPALTRAAESVKVKIGRSEFVADDTLVFTTIKRTDTPLEPFTYSNIKYVFEDGTSWERTPNGTKNDPEKIYWTDGSSAHTFIGYSLPSKQYHWEAIDQGTNGYTYAGELAYGQTEIDFTEGNEKIMLEDLLLNYSENTQAESDGLSTKVQFTHALSSVRVVINIKNFAATASAVDTKVRVSDMIIFDQPTQYTWGANSNTLTVVDFDKQGDGCVKPLKLWCPDQVGEGTGQNKTFTFYGLTTPQDATFHSINSNSTHPLTFQFTVTYPDPMNPNGEPLVKTYRGAFSQMVNFESGKQTTLNISLNHKDEQIFMGVEYNDWNFVATPDLGELRKKSTFLNVSIEEVTVYTDAKATMDDATWLYKDKTGVVRDVYGNDGSESSPYRISTAPQMLSFAKEVNTGNSFLGKYVRLDADITLQKNTTDTDYQWASIGDASHPFDGTFQGGERYINRLSGQPLFAKLGTSACVEQLQVTTVGSITGGGALAETNEGVIAACRVIDDVETTGGALVGINSGVIYACYHTGETKGLAGLVGTNSGSIVGCYQAGDVVGGTAFSIAYTNTGTVSCPVPTSLYAMQQSDFVDMLNSTLNNWYEADVDKKYTVYTFSHMAANYPKIGE